jgi:hypothetical protein
MGTESVPETLENFHTVTRLSAGEGFIGSTRDADKSLARSTSRCILFDG